MAPPEEVELKTDSVLSLDVFVFVCLIVVLPVNPHSSSVKVLEDETIRPVVSPLGFCWTKFRNQFEGPVTNLTDSSPTLCAITKPATRWKQSLCKKTNSFL